jgi:quercetin dioxygenase-like cupin family protein
MTAMAPGVTKAGQGQTWHLLGQTYVAKQISDASFAWEATFPAGTFVPPHIHPTQDEFIWVMEGKFELVLDGQAHTASAGDLVRMPMGNPHGIFNKTETSNRALMWVSPTRQLVELFNAINNMSDIPEMVRISAGHEVQFLPPKE